ncbi:hypothetical protein K432DRAFT_176158 [Lepidopterella palustris CBS 459.81]|uniref:Uncharacterized protein n=1 Tax=Lepidopterella palustris CBS 459.81 TaxID=1314670 RepID=A0A8E2E157_9PEZI|nr:hypothetical protein K432DRAFT_176158 [Lepidopterella palustris CBS 459.81]
MTAAKLCCTAEQRSGSSSPDLPNARLSDATPARRPLLPARGDSTGSRFTSARSEDLHELQQIFDSAAALPHDVESPTKNRDKRRARTTSSSHNLEKIKSVQALIKKKLSIDFPPRSKSSTHTPGHNVPKTDSLNESGTVIKIARQGANIDIQITKQDLRNDLLSDKGPEEGGYDSDAEVLDDIVKRLGKKTPTKRTSLHSIEWSPSTIGSLSSNHRTPGMNSGVRHSCEGSVGNYFYQITKLGLGGNTPPPARLPQYSSSPNLRSKGTLRARILRRSRSTTSIDVPATPNLQPVRLPSISSFDATPWSLSMVESLRLSAFPLPPHHPISQQVQRSSHSFDDIQRINITSWPLRGEADQELHEISEETEPEKPSHEKMSNNEPTDKVGDAAVGKENLCRYLDSDPADSGLQPSSASVHLHSMRISQHLRSGSLLSSATSTHSPKHPQHVRVQSAVSHSSKHPTRSRHDRKTSSSGFASTNVPITWGSVVRADAENKNEADTVPEDECSSVYSSRPQSPDDSIKGSIMSLSWAITHADISMNTTVDLTRHALAVAQATTFKLEPPPPNRSLSDPFVNNESEEASSKDCLLVLPTSSASANSSSTSLAKKSRFREEFSPSPPHKKASKRRSALKFLRPRIGTRSQSDANFFDGPDDDDPRERKISQSMISLKAEQETLEHHHHDTSPMWERALKAYQEERSTMFLSPNKALATSGSPLRERSQSLSRPRSLSGSSVGEHLDMPGTPSSRQTPSPRLSMDLVSQRRGALFPYHDDLTPVSGRSKDSLHGRIDGEEEIDTRPWSRYPSHSRDQRTGSAGHGDDVKTRDFALEMNISSALDANTANMKTPTWKLKKKRMTVSKSSSLNFGKTFWKGYTKLFRSQSTEFQRHGYGHRSSVTTGGTLHYPELEILPGFWRGGIGEGVQEEGMEMLESMAREAKEAKRQDESAVAKSRSGKAATDDVEQLKNGTKGEVQMINIDGAADVPAPPTLDGVADVSTTTLCGAHIWSRFYESCVEYPRSLSVDDESFSQWDRDHMSESVSENKKRNGKISLGRESGMRQSETTKSLPARLKHVRNESVGSGAGGNGVSEVMRRSTADLLRVLMEAERRERERVLRLVSLRGEEGL